MQSASIPATCTLHTGMPLTLPNEGMHDKPAGTETPRHQRQSRGNLKGAGAQFVHYPTNCTLCQAPSSPMIHSIHVIHMH